jgi:hypothetical protein
MEKCGRGYTFKIGGWDYLHIEGDALERGYQHGFLMAEQLRTIIDACKFMTMYNTGKTWEFFRNAAVALWTGKIPKELMREMKGISMGAQEAGVDIDFYDILTWNGQEELSDYWWPNEVGKLGHDRVFPTSDHCSAFMAHGEATEDGQIVMGHNSFNEFALGQFSNLILDIVPTEGNQMFMQSSPGWVDSFSDFFVTSGGIMGTETTMGGFGLYDPDGVPEFVRVREAMQYAECLDDFMGTMLEHNNGGYANSWLLGDYRTGDIMRFELGLKLHSAEMNPRKVGIGKGPGYFIGFNAPCNDEIRHVECSNTGYNDIRRHQGARQVRLRQLMDRHHGRITAELGQEIMADHIDPYHVQINSMNLDGKLPDDNPSSRTVCSHYYLDPRQFMSDPTRPFPFQPRGAVDGKTMSQESAKEMRFWARWGNSCGMVFDAEEFIEKHPQWLDLKDILQTRGGNPWVEVWERQHPDPKGSSSP